MKKKLKSILFLLSVILIILVIKHFNNKIIDKKYNEIHFDGIFSQKYIDTQDHYRPKIKIINKSDTIIFDLQNDNSGLYEAVRKNDTLIKMPSCLDIRVINQKRDTTFRLNFGKF
ncbi:MAG: hypothetical protein M0Q53_01615 [Prolixibacteraceae bacterium]|jgi:hypothetical protein|nr:hypothetical protein [Prolixibacteraceae bacterium]